MFERSGRKILISLVTGTLLSAMALSPGFAASSDERETYHLLDNSGNPVKTTRDKECVQTNSRNQPPQLFEECGDVIDGDGDGVPDDRDDCPNNTPREISRGVDSRGCPVDSDGDGVPDYRDDCPNNTSLEISRGVDSDGCPKDSDMDGVFDYRDKCPGTPLGEPVDADGCARIDTSYEEVLSSDITFGFDEYAITEQGRQTLDNIVNEIFSNYDKFTNLTVVGHTDSIGTDEYNQRLSELRAEAVKDYFISRGIPSEKIYAEGRGEFEPKADNETKEGRAINRRVEIRVEIQ